MAANKNGKTKSKQKAKDTEIVVLLDRSGSMTSIREDMMGGFDTFIAEQKKVPGACRVTLAQFDDKYEIVYSSVALSKVPPLELVPRGSTALLDALGRTIAATRDRMSRKRKNVPQVLFVIITDGCENSSREFNHMQVMQVIKDARESDGWEFVYLGANQDAFAVGGGLGIGTTQNFAATSKGVHDALRSVSVGATSYRSTGVYTTDSSDES